VASAVSAIAIAAYRSLTGREVWLWAAVYGSLIIPILVISMWKKFLEFGDSLPPKTPKSFDSNLSPFWWRHFDMFLAIAAVAWISLLLATSISSTPELVIRSLWWIMGMGPMAVIGIGSLIEILFRRVPDKPV